MNEIVVDKDRLIGLIDLLWDYTCECPPIHDFNNEEYQCQCPMMDNEEADCGRCWLNYVVNAK